MDTIQMKKPISLTIDQPSTRGWSSTYSRVITTNTAQ